MSKKRYIGFNAYLGAYGNSVSCIKVCCEYPAKSRPSSLHLYPAKFIQIYGAIVVYYSTDIDVLVANVVHYYNTSQITRVNVPNSHQAKEFAVVNL